MIKTIGWCSDFNVVKNNSFIGGGEKTEHELIKRAPNNFVVKYIKATSFDYNCDFYIVNNFRTYNTDDIDFLINNKHIMSWRDVIDTPHDNRVRELYKTAKLNVFLSPLHKKAFLEKFNITDKDYNCIDIAPYFDFDKYIREPKFEDRKKDICWIGDIQHHKDIESIIIWARETGRVIDFFGKGNLTIVQQIQESKYARYCGYTDNIHTVYPEYKYFIHKPDKVEAFGRSCMEAYLSDCSIISNDKVGMYSWEQFANWDYDDIRDWIEQQPGLFWDSVVVAIN